MSEEILTVQKAMQLSSEYLKKRGFQNPRLEAELLLGKVLNKTRVQLYVSFEEPLSESEKETYRALLKRRAEFEPVAYILGEKEFLSRSFVVDAGVLIPRPETELLVEKAIDYLKILRNEKEPPLSVFEIGVGSGIISISIAMGLNYVECVGVDISEAALKIACENVGRYKLEDRVKFSQADLFAGNTQKYDMIVSNPPYVCETDKPSIAKDVLNWEPHSALFAGDDGLDIIRKIIAEAPEHLNDKGYLIFEIGYNQEQQIKGLIEKSGHLDLVEIAKDLARIPRTVVVRKK